MRLDTTRPGRRRAWLAIGLAAAVAAAASLPGGLELRVVPLGEKEPLLVLPLAEGERFTLHYYHSVENTPIWEEHRLDAEGNIYIEEERYQKLGAGMGRTPGVGRWVRRGPYEAIVDMHRPTGDFVLRVGSPGVDHTVIWRGTRTNLSLVAPHAAVRFTARPVGPFQRLKRLVAPHPKTPVSGGVRDG